MTTAAAAVAEAERQCTAPQPCGCNRSGDGFAQHDVHVRIGNLELRHHQCPTNLWISGIAGDVSEGCPRRRLLKQVKFGISFASRTALQPMSSGHFTTRPSNVSARTAPPHRPSWDQTHTCTPEASNPPATRQDTISHDMTPLTAYEGTLSPVMRARDCLRTRPRPPRRRAWPPGLAHRRRKPPRRRLLRAQLVDRTWHLARTTHTSRNMLLSILKAWCTRRPADRPHASEKQLCCLLGGNVHALRRTGWGGQVPGT